MNSREEFSAQYSLKRNTVNIFGPIDDAMSKKVISELQYLKDNDAEEIIVQINSSSGSISAGLAIYDTMNTSKARIVTVGLGTCASIGAFLLSAGSKGYRRAMENTQIILKQPLGGIDCQGTNIIMSADYIKRTSEIFNRILAKNTGKSIETIAQDTGRDYIMTAKDALSYGLIDTVIYGNKNKGKEEELLRQAWEALEERKIEILRLMQEKIESEQDVDEDDDDDIFFDLDDEADSNKDNNEADLERKKQELLRQLREQLDNIESKDRTSNYGEREDANGKKAKVAKKRKPSKIFRLEHSGSKRNCWDIKFEYPRNALWRENKRLFDKAYNEELSSLVVSSQKDIEQDEALSVAIDKMQTMIDCKNYFKAQVLEQIINELKQADYGEFDNLKHIAWKDIMNNESDKYFIIQNGALKKYKGKSKYLHIPEGVTKISNKLLDDCSEFSFIHEVEMPESLREIGEEAFFGCDFIEKITFHSGLIKIDNNAFFGANGLKNAIVPETVSEMGESAFRHCDLRFIRFGKGLKTIKEMTFYESSLEQIEIPRSIENVGYLAFGECLRLKKVTFIGGMKNINAEAFSGSDNIRTIQFVGAREELEEIKRNLYYDSEGVDITTCVDDNPDNISDGRCQRDSECRGVAEGKRLKGLPFLDNKKVHIIFKEEHENNK